ncbi:MAG: hypothetical protein AMXMBFR82_30970 [Candidatus Hydrogenedentota bacterium]
MSTTATMREPRRRRTLIAVCVVGIVLVVLGLAGAGVWAALGRADRLYAQVAELEASIRERGQPVTLEELNAYYPAVPDEENAALVYEEAFRLLESIDPEGERTADLLEQLNGVSRVAPSGLVEEVEAHLESCEAVFEVLARAAGYPESRYPVDFRRGVATELPHLKPLRTCVRLEALRGSYAVLDGRFDAFADSQRSVFALSRSLRYEPQIIAQLVRIAAHAIAAESLENALKRSELRDETLVELADLYGSTENIDAVVRTYAGERCIFADAVYRTWIGDRGEGWPEITRPSLKSRIRIALNGGRERIATGERLAMLQYLTPLANAPDLSWPERMELSERTYESTKDLPDSKVMSRTMLPALARGIGAFARDAAVLRMARTALTIELYRSSEGDLPSELDALVPKYLPAPTLDPFDGEPLRYRRHEEGYAIYSIYSDLKDDNGVQAEKDESGEWLGDWVFEVRR